MGGTEALHAQNRTENTSWRGVDFSGVTVILGVGTGRMIELLNRESAASEGDLLVVDSHPSRLRALLPLRTEGPLLPVHGRYRQIPALSETVDLLVVNGVLREVPESKLAVMFQELRRVLVPGGQLRISDIIEPSEADYDQAWAERNRIVRKLGLALQRPTALYVNLRRAAKAMSSTGFEDLTCSLLPGYVLTDSWLQETANAVRRMASRLVDRRMRDEILTGDLPRLEVAYAKGKQRAAERFVLSGRKVSHLVPNVAASLTVEDLAGEEN